MAAMLITEPPPALIIRECRTGTQGMCRKGRQYRAPVFFEWVLPNTLIKPTASDHFSEGYHQAGVQSVSRVPGIITFPGGLPIMTANKHRLGER